ncbi:MAG: AgmX/PglI C-terminal domain-containing protein [Deltaproteobacteria bacterium]|nr:AgmX/PglI C-terminal domain-containing protein [Deltaproteobacteria bacterium]
MSTSIPPPPTGSGNGKYIAIGLLFLGLGGGAVYLALRKPAAVDTPPVRTVSVVDAGPPPSLTPTIAANIDLSDEPDVEVPSQDATAPRVRYVVRYVDQCPGTIDSARVDGILAGSQGGFRECYNRELRSNPTLRGGATVRFTITPSGAVGDISSGGIVRSGPFRACFETILRRLRFPAPRGGCVVKETRFNFST